MYGRAVHVSHPVAQCETICRRPADLGQFLSSEVEGDGLCVAGVVDFDVDLVVVLVFPDERSLEAGHLVLLPVHKDLRVGQDGSVVGTNSPGG